MRTIRKNKLQNDGFSLLELIIVIAIISVTLFFFVTSIVMILNLPAKQCSRELKAALEKMRVDTMGRDGAGLRIYKGSDGCIYLEELVSKDDGKIVENPEKRIGNKKVTIKYKKNEGDPGEELNNTGVVLAFKRDTGGLYDDSDGREIKTGTKDYNVVFISEFRISSGKKAYLVSIRKLTGMVELTDVSGK